MCSKNVRWLRKPSRRRMPRRYNKVRLVLIQICSESIAIGRHSVLSVDQVRWLWCQQQSMGAWGLEGASGNFTRTLETKPKLDVQKIYWSKLSLFRFCERILQLGDIQCSMQARWGGHDDEGDLWENEVWQMHQENLWRNLDSNRHRLLGEYYKVS